jgi:hypothetical protein
VADRIALAELYHADLHNDQAASQAALSALEREPLYAPAFRLLITVYSNAAENDRVFGVLSLLEAMGDLEDIERTYLEDLRSRVKLYGDPRGALSDDVRTRYLMTPPLLGPLTDLWQAVREHFERPYVKQIEANPPPAADHFTRATTPTLRQLIAGALRLSSSDVDVYVKRDATFIIHSEVGPKPCVYLGPVYATGLTDGERRFLLGKHLEYLRLGAPLFLRLDPAEAQATLDRTRELLAPENERSQQARELFKLLPRKNAKRATELSALAAQSVIPTAMEWIEAVERTTDRAGLIIAGEIGPALSSLAKLAAREAELPVVGPGRVSGAPGGMDLVRYLLSDDHFSLRRAISAWR